MSLTRMFEKMMLIAVVAMFTGTFNTARAQDTGPDDQDVWHQLEQFRGSLKEAREMASSASAKADLALAETAAARICPTKCETETELAAAQGKIKALGAQIAWIRREHGKEIDALQEDVGKMQSVMLTYGLAIVALDAKIDATNGRVTFIEGWAAEVSKWTLEIDAWRKVKDETDDRQDDALVGLVDTARDHEERIHDQESVRGAANCRVFAGAGFYSGTEGKIVTGVSTPIFGGCGAELQMRDDKSRIWILEGALLGHFDPSINDAGAGGHIGIGMVLNPLKKQDWTLTLGGEAMRLSTKNVDGFSDASRWDIRPGFDVKKSWFVDRVRIDIGLWGRITAGMGTQVSDDIYNTHTNLTRFGAAGGAFLQVAIGPKWDRWVKRH